MKKNSVRTFTAGRIERVTSTIMSAPWDDPRVYGDMLAQTYYHICHSTRLLVAAASRFTVEQEELHQQCLKHASEERSHEKLSRSDLEHLGFRLEEFPELPGTKSLYRSAYYLIDHVSPLSLFGYAYFLEWIAVEAGSKMLAVTEPRYGKNAVKHLHVHTKEDPEHIQAYESRLEKFPEEERDIICESVDTTANEYQRIYEEILARSAKKPMRRAG